ncbi:cytochrome P450 [Absidia repens]|uniref:Cytochrome P450 n=1 Tax=Absidia repens TaxID=90262 RepID=A0A1X2ILH4_9FUNG|nr:cytochrome P450 [Absidia repens]
MLFGSSINIPINRKMIEDHPKTMFLSITAAAFVAVWAANKSLVSSSSSSASNASQANLAPGALPLVGHLFTLSKDPRRFIDYAKKESGPSSELNLGPGETKLIAVWPILTRIIARITCLCFAGRQVTNVPHFVDAMAHFTRKIITAGTFLALLPTWLGNVVVRRFLSLEHEIDLILNHLTPQLEHIKQDGKVDDDEQGLTFGSWLMTVPRRDGSLRTPKQTAYHFKDVVLASVHTTSHFLTFAIHELSCRPDLVQALRDEINTTLPDKNDRSANAINDLPLLDSFLREVLRCNVDYLGLHHKAVQDVVMSNGVVIPKGALVFCAMDEANRVVTDPGKSGTTCSSSLDVFDAYRHMGVALDEKCASLTTDFITFGNGPHACPGRHFAIMEIKFNISKFVTRYNIKSPTGQRAKDSVIMGMTRNPPHDPILFEGI